MAEENNIPYETKFEDGSEITDYTAVGVAEGFVETEGNTDAIRAWSYICGKELWKGLQGFFGRNVNTLIEDGVLRGNGKVDWDAYDELINNQ
jgi:hypothetical protein